MTAEAMNTRDRKIVFHVSHEDPARLLAAVASSELILKHVGDDVVIDIIAQSSSVAGSVRSAEGGEELEQRLAGLPTVTMYLCEMAVDGNNVDRSQIVDGIEITPSASAFVAQRQFDGFAYIRP